MDLDLLDWYHSNLTTSRGGIIVAEIEGKIVGELDYCYSFDNILEFKGNRYHIIWLLVHPDYRRQGIANLMIDFLIQELEEEVWVEPEDTRSVSLYEGIGEQIYSISNWNLNLRDIPESMVDHRLKYQRFNLDVLPSLKENYSLLFGRYYAPNYDIQQFLNSDEVSEFMWGDTDVADVFYYNHMDTQVYAVMTQYPRIWVEENYDPNYLKEILSSICLYLFESGFDDLYFQIYNDPEVKEILNELNFECTITDDPVYRLKR